MQSRLLTALTALISDEEMVKMIEQLIEEEWLIDSPFLRRIRQEGRHEGQEIGRAEGWREGQEIGRAEGWREGQEIGRAEGWREGREEGLHEGSFLIRRRDILEALMIRFDPPASTYRRVEEALLKISDEARLQALFAEAIRCPDVAAFQAALADDQAEFA
jgi:predicted transposase YdaD